MKCQHCTEKTEKEILGVWLCTTHYIEALEHSADMSFDAEKLDRAVTRGLQKTEHGRLVKLGMARNKEYHQIRKGEL